MNKLWLQTTRGADKPDLIIMDNNYWSAFMASLQTIQRFTDTQEANLGFPSIKFMDADCILDGGIGGAIQAGTAYFLNPKYIHYRPHAQRNQVPLSPNKRYSTNQDAEVQILAWAGALTCNGARSQGRIYTT
jgi:hypothetical protein